MKTLPQPPHGSATLFPLGLSRTGTLTLEASLKSRPATFPDTCSAISLPASGDGHTPLNSQDGPQTAPSGPAPAPASLSRSRAKALAPVTNGICGPTSCASSVPAGPLWSWENRLRERLASVGSTEFSLTWKLGVTPGGRSVSRLVQSMRPTSAVEATGAPWPTPTVADVQGGRMTRSGARNNEPPLNGLMHGAAWMTPCAREAEKADCTLPVAMGRLRDGKQISTAMQMRMAHGRSAAVWTTVTSDATDRTKPCGQGGTPPGLQMIGTAHGRPTATSANGTWSTPRASDGEKGGPNQSFGAGGQPLPEQMHQATWPTVTARDWRSGEASQATHDWNARPLNEQMAATARGGPTPTSSPATTARRDVPNPEFPCWLMGFPADWLNGAASATPSSRRSQPK